MTKGRAPVLWTVGHSSLDPAGFLDLLRGAELDAVVDVRRFPRSRRHPHFDRDALRASLAAAGIDYVHEEDLGGHRRPRPDSPHLGLADEAFRAYADHMATPAFAAALARVVKLARRRRTAVMCAERDWRRCHRGLLADRLVAGGARVIHLAPGGTEGHALRPGARMERGRLFYPGMRQLGLGDWLEG